MLEIKLCGRGGQGTVVASQILGLAFFKAGYYPQCYSIYGGERRGAPVAAFMRVSKKPILLKCEIKQPNQLIFLDETLFNPVETDSLIADDGLILINSQADRKSFGQPKGKRLGLIDAGRVATDQGLGKMINTAVLGAYCRLNREPGLEALKEAVEETVPAKKAANLAAVEEAYKTLRTDERGESR